LLRIVAERGLDEVSVREVAAAAGVSIGTVQHYFPTKDDMLAAAFNEVVLRVRTRITSVTLGTDVRHNLSTVLRELLPLDNRRAEEARIMVAFAARAATSPALADIQRTVLTEINEELTEAFTLAAAGRATAEQCTLAAHVAVAAADGLALHTVSSGGGMSTRQLTAALELLLDALVPNPADKTAATYS
jgi:AcrR family transcriptional regulator